MSTPKCERVANSEVKHYLIGRILPDDEAQKHMDIKEIATKVINGAKVEDVIKDVPEDKKTEFLTILASLAKEESDKALETLKGRRAANQAIEADKEKLETEAVTKVRSQIRSEQVTKARARFMSDHGLTEEQMKPVDDAFKTTDSGKFDADLIIPDLRRAYGMVHADTLIESEKIARESQKSAAEFNSAATAGGSTGGGGNDGGKVYSPRIHEWVREAAKQGIHLTLDEAERGLKGGTRVFK